MGEREERKGEIHEARTFFAVMLVIVKREAVVTGTLIAPDRVLTDMLTTAIA